MTLATSSPHVSPSRSRVRPDPMQDEDTEMVDLSLPPPSRPLVSMFTPLIRPRTLTRLQASSSKRVTDRRTTAPPPARETEADLPYMTASSPMSWKGYDREVAASYKAFSQHKAPTSHSRDRPSSVAEARSLFSAAPMASRNCGPTLQHWQANTGVLRGPTVPTALRKPSRRAPRESIGNVFIGPSTPSIATNRGLQLHALQEPAVRSRKGKEKEVITNLEGSLYPQVSSLYRPMFLKVTASHSDGTRARRSARCFAAHR